MIMLLVKVPWWIKNRDTRAVDQIVIIVVIERGIDGKAIDLTRRPRGREVVASVHIISVLGFMDNACCNDEGFGFDGGHKF
jgi:hypothetical protein